MARFLGIETSSAVGSLALAEDNIPVREVEIDTRLNHSARLLPVLDELLRQAGWKLGDLDGVGIGLGPGSFTGIRVGLAAGQGLAFGCSLPLIGVGSFPALVRGSSLSGGLVVPLLDGGRGRIYGARYRQDETGIRELISPRLVKPGELKDLVRGGRVITPDGLRLRPHLEAAGIRQWEEASPRAREVAILAGEKFAAGEFELVEPIYLSKLSYAKISNK